ncbi:bifunctional glutamate N-acetyltransferase/amino-acid acetyltransferase ArgJ [Ileibacterium valens]|uniref:bifunctional glutamate N-acetyltransferase/amino-acid acetyltransferase ArgJ n=1 Tax=Ileibacterium valens TaxID=1862668 RepID=UPI00272B2195|nr:bifunctional glutamate N-acetyltransferase/amino-acid acetyltransferase ArgJ [Ileibacterium valens]
MSKENKGVCFAKGFTAGAAHAGIKEGSTKDDLAIIYSSTPCNAAAVYTTNVVKAAPLKVTKEHLNDGRAQAIIINSGNANAAAMNGELHAIETAQKAAEVLGLKPEDVLVASTGVIGQELNVDVILKTLPKIELSNENSEAANLAIMTTDTKTKTCGMSFELNGKECHIGGICKGSGMIHPNMGTMLAFITTDAAISSEMLQKALKANVRTTFNRISVDGDTSTNDMVIVLANGQAENEEIISEGKEYKQFFFALHQVMECLAVQIAADGEGASRLITCTVSGANTEDQAETLARSVVSSSLTKAAMFGRDANWGRVICAMGYSGADFDPDHVDIAFGSAKGEIVLCKDGRETKADDDVAYEILGEDAIDILITLHEGNESATCWGCDLTYDYVTINKDYRT